MRTPIRTAFIWVFKEFTNRCTVHCSNEIRVRIWPELEFSNYQGALESIPRNQFSHLMQPGPVRQPYSYSIPSLHRLFKNSLAYSHLNEQHRGVLNDLQRTRISRRLMVCLLPHPLPPLLLHADKKTELVCNSDDQSLPSWCVPPFLRAALC